MAALAAAARDQQRRHRLEEVERLSMVKTLQVWLGVGVGRRVLLLLLLLLLLLRTSVSSCECGAL
jgi:hypothetical protein